MRSEAKWQEIDELLAAVARLSRSHLPEDEFARQVLGQLLHALPCAAAGFWKIDQNDQIRLTSLLQREGATCPETLVAYGPRLAVVQQVQTAKVATVAGVSLPETSTPSDFGSHVSADRGALLVCPVTLDDRCVAVLELIQDEFLVAGDRQWSLDVLGSVAELCADDCRQRRLNWLAERELLWRRLRQFALDIHRNLDVNDTAYAVVNDGRSLIDCDRLTLLSAELGVCRVLAVSGAANCDPRSDTVRHLEQLAAAIAAIGSPVIFPAADLPPEVREPPLAYIDAAGAKSLAVVPLSAPAPDPAAAPAEVTGVLVAEQFSRVIDSDVRERLLLVSEHVACALKSARRFRQAPWMALVGEDRWRRMTAGKSRLRLWLYAAAAVFVLGWIIPAKYEIECRGEVQPRVRREVFATDDAVVEELKVNHDDRVEQGQVLAIMRNPQLDLEFKRVSGELQTTRERLAAVQAARVELAVESAGRPAGAARLSGEEAGLRALLTSLERQSKLLDEQQDALTVRSPIAGRILTWDLPQLLQNRPVLRGQVLMTVADTEGPWVLELHVPEKRVGALISARQSGDPKLPVTFVLATDPGRTHRSQIDDVAAAVEPDRSDEPAVLVTAGVNRELLNNPRPGAGVTGRVSCGLRPIAYVWLRDLIDAVWAWVWF